MNLKLKIIAGFRKDQEYSIEADEAHKAYFLFLHPEARGIFRNGIAMVGSDIHRIEPDYHGSMGWNTTHQLDSDDWNDIRSRGLEVKIQNLLAAGKEIASLGSPEDINIPLSELLKTKYVALTGKRNDVSDEVKRLAESKRM